jgi:transporter family-2 protein
MKVFQVEPKYMLLGGVLGAFITYTVIQSMSSLGPARAAMLIVVSQLITAYLIEVFGMFGMERTGFSFRKVIGMVIAIFGILVFKWE